MEYEELKSILTYNKVKELFEKKKYAFFDKGNYNLNIFGVRLKTGENLFDDAICVAYRDHKGKPRVTTYMATTDPGLHYLHGPISQQGTAILAEGQYRGAYCVGYHQGKYMALCQRKTVTVYRDKDMDSEHDFNPQDKRSGIFGINIHNSSPKGVSTYVDKWSAGCQVFKKATDFNKFMTMVLKAKIEYGNSFTYTLLNAEEVSKYISK